MKKIFLLLFVFSIAGCDQIKDEFHTSGGYPAQIMDETTFVARTQQEHLHRYFYILASAAPMALYSVNDEDGAQDAFRHANSAINKLNNFKTAMGEDVNSKTSTAIKDTKAGFETNSLEAQRAIWLLASDVKNNIGLEIKVSDPASIVTSTLGILKRAKSLAGPFRNFAAAYRETIHISTQSATRVCEGTIQEFIDTEAKKKLAIDTEAKKKLADDEQSTSPTVGDATTGQDQDRDTPSLVTLSQRELEKIKGDARRKYSVCHKLIAAEKKFYEDGTKLSAIILESQTYERQLKILQTRTIDVIESNELGSKGFLDDEGIYSLNLLIKEACLHAAKFSDELGTNSCGTAIAKAKNDGGPDVETLATVGQL